MASLVLLPWGSHQNQLPRTVGLVESVFMLLLVPPESAVIALSKLILKQAPPGKARLLAPLKNSPGRSSELTGAGEKDVSLKNPSRSRA